MNDKKQLARCGYPKKNGEPCQQFAGHGTDHVGSGYCKFHRGATGNKTRGKDRSDKQSRHGLYQRFFDPDDLEKSKELQGNLLQEIAIARLQLVRLLKLNETDDLYLSRTEIRQIENGKSLDSIIGKIKQNRAKFAKQAGEYYDPDDDDYSLPEEGEDKAFEVKKEYKRIDFFHQFGRIIRIIESLERTQMSIEVDRAALLKAERGIQEDDIDEFNDESLDREICKLLEIPEDGTD